MDRSLLIHDIFSLSMTTSFWAFLVLDHDARGTGLNIAVDGPLHVHGIAVSRIAITNYRDVGGAADIL